MEKQTHTHQSDNCQICPRPPHPDSTAMGWEEEFDILYGDTIEQFEDEIVIPSGKKPKDALKGWICNLLSAQMDEVVKIAEGMARVGKIRQYDGNDIKSAGDAYNIAAESWDEIIRFEDGYRFAISDLITTLEAKKA